MLDHRGDLPFVRVYLQPPFYIKMHVTKYGYNEFGPMVPWASLYTKFTVLVILSCLTTFRRPGNAAFMAEGQRERETGDGQVPHNQQPENW